MYKTERVFSVLISDKCISDKLKLLLKSNE